MSFLSTIINIATVTQALLPMPQHVEWKNGSFDCTRPYHVENYYPGVSNNIYLQELTGKPDDSAGRICIIRHEDMAAEGYRLHITPDTLLITASDRSGFIYAGQTLKQLAVGGVLPCCDISDAPRFEWRGCMIDVSRHYFDLDCLKRQIDLMASVKLNRLHLHLTDAAGWRLQIDRYPLLTRIAAWRTHSDWDEWWVKRDRRYVDSGKGTASKDTYGYYYTKEQIRELIGYANARGIMIVPEIEMPGHSEEVLAVYPELSCLSDTGALSQSPDDEVIRGMNSGDLCPCNDKTFEFLCNVLDEVMALFPSPYIHIGGDEANMTAWRTCPRCQSRLRQLGTDDVAALQHDLISRINTYLNQHGHKLIGWDEITASVNTSSYTPTAMVWREAYRARQAIHNGYDVIMAPNSHCYLNRSQDAPQGRDKQLRQLFRHLVQPDLLRLNLVSNTIHLIKGLVGILLQKRTRDDFTYLPFNQVATFDPLEALDEEEQRHVKGIEACLWTEFITDQKGLENRLYPRLLALAEAAWRGKANQDIRERATEKAVALINKGVHAFDLRYEVGERPESKDTIAHLARHARVTYLRPYNRYYPAQGPGTLTDGLRGGWLHSDGRWQGFIGDSCVNIIIDLGRQTRFNSVSMDFVQNAGPDIYLPALFVIKSSNDGKQWQERYRKTSKKDERQGLSFNTWQWTGKAEARFLHIIASSHDENSWIFTDEVIVR